MLVLSGIAWALKLGGPGRIDDADQAMRLAEDAIAGFDATEAVVGADGLGALVFGAGGSVALIRPSGARFLVRKMWRPGWRVTGTGIEIETGDRVPLPLGVTQAEAAAISARLDAATDNDVNSTSA